MKILITTDAYDTMINGVAVSVRNLQSALKAAGHDVRVLTLSQSHHSYVDGDVYYIKSIPIKIYPDARATVSFNTPLLEDIIDWAPQIIHSQCEFFTFVFAKKLARHLNIPIVHTYHTLYEYYTHYFCPNKTLGKKIVSTGSRLICNHADAVIAPTKKTEHILKNYGVSSPIAVIPTGLSLEMLQKPVDENFQTELKTSLHIPENVPVLVTVGRLAREKNIDFLIEQMQTPKVRSRNAHLVIVGDGPDRSRLEALVSDAGLRENVHFTGMIPSENIYRYYHLGDIFVSASNSETQGLTYIEAMACGLPVLCMKDECLKTILNPEVNGCFFEDSESFAKGLMMLTEKSRISFLKNNALKTAENFSKKTFAKRAVKLYDNVILRYHTMPVLYYTLPGSVIHHFQKRG